jgi:mannose-6-phosphate isomerase-like protein (cupin superfamily)
MTQTRFIYHTADAIRYRFPTHANDLVMDRAEAETTEAFIVVLEPGEAPPLHVHDDAEQVFFVQKGAGMLHIGAEPRQIYPVRPGDLVRIPSHTPHRTHCEGTEALVYLSIGCFLRGRPVAEPTWESHVRAMCTQNGWNIEEVAPHRKKDH